MNEYYIVDDDGELITFLKTGERDNGRLFELSLKGDPSEEDRMFVFPVAVLSANVTDAYKAALKKAEYDMELIVANFTRLRNQKDKASVRINDLQEKIQGLE